MAQASVLRSVILMVLLFTGVTAIGFKPGGYTVKGNVTAPDGTLFYLYYRYNDNMVIDSATASANQFVLKGNFPEPVICTLSNSKNKQLKIFLAENAEITLKGDVDKLYNLEILNAHENYLYNDFKLKSSELSGKYRLAVKNTGADLHDKTSKPYQAFHSALDSLVNSFIKINSNSTAAALAIIDSYVTNPDRANAQKFYKGLSPKIQQSVYGKKIAHFFEAVRTIAEGMPAPNFSLKDLDSKTVKLSDYKGSYVFVDFWASWCGPCRKENPGIVGYHKTFASDKLKFISISMDADARSWRKAVATDKLSWTQLNDPESTQGKVADIYGIKSLPFNLVVDPDGIIIATNLRGEALGAFLSKKFKSN